MKQDLVKSENIERVLSLLQSMYDIVIIDSSTAFNEVMAKAFEVADIALLITTLDIPAIKNLKIVMGTLDSLNFPPSRRKVILNRADQKIGISVGDVEDLVSAEVSIKVPNSAEVSQSINDGIPLVIAQPRNPVSKAFEEMGELIIAMEKSLEHESVA
jgi:pilus assembly protein CpaE